MYDKNKPPKLVLTFNGARDQQGFNRIEILRPAKKNTKGEAIDLIDIEMSTTGGKPHVSVNPKECRQCHSSTSGSPQRPLFNAVPVWPGYYGVSVFSGLIPKSETEKQNAAFKMFQESAPDNSRYKYLVGLQSLSAITNAEAYHGGMTVMGSNQKNEMADDQQLPIRNRRFTEAMAEMNHPRLAELVKRSKDYDKYKYAILAVVSNCASQAEDMLPSSWKAKNNNRSHLDPLLSQPLTTEIAQALNEKKYDSRKRLRAPEDSQFFKDTSHVPSSLTTMQAFAMDTSLRQAFYGANTYRTAVFRYLFEARSQPVDMRDWNIDPQKGSYRFNNNKAVDDDYIAIAPLLIKDDADLAPYVANAKLGDGNSGDQSMTGIDCEGLKKKSLLELDRLSNDRLVKKQSAEVCPIAEKDGRRELAEFSNEIARSTLKKNCSGCHASGSNNGPILDFSVLNCSKLLRDGVKNRIGVGEDAEGHMPQLGRLTNDERSTISSYLGRLDQSKVDTCPSRKPDKTEIPNFKTGKQIVDNVCVKCHKDRDNAANLGANYFAEPSSVRTLGPEICRRISEPIESDDHMPRFVELRPSQVTELKSYFKTLDPSFKCK